MPRDRSSIHGHIFRAAPVSLEQGRKLLESPAIRIVSEGRRGRLEHIEVDGVAYARKVYKITKKSLHGTAVKLLPAFMRWGRVRRSWNAMLKGAESGLPIPRPFVRSENRESACLVSSWVPGEPLHHWHARHLHEDSGVEWQILFSRWLGQQLFHLFHKGFRTRDLAPNNVMISGDRNGPWSLNIVDLDEARVGMCPKGESGVDQVMHSLAQIGHLPPTVSPRIRWRCLISFLEAGGTTWADESGEYSASSTDFMSRRNSRKQLLRNAQQRPHRFDHPKEEGLLRQGRTARYAGWGLDDEGLPVPFDGAKDLS